MSTFRLTSWRSRRRGFGAANSLFRLSNHADWKSEYTSCSKKVQKPTFPLKYWHKGGGGEGSDRVHGPNFCSTNTNSESMGDFTPKSRNILSFLLKSSWSKGGKGRGAVGTFDVCNHGNRKSIHVSNQNKQHTCELFC